MADPEKIARISRLLDLYGRLLTERQLEFARAHYEEDLTFAEISEGLGISRQAVHDAVKSAEEAVERYESVLALLDRDAAAPPAAPEPPPAPDFEPAPAPAAASDAAEVAGEMRELADRIARTGFAQSPQNLARQLSDLADRLD